MICGKLLDRKDVDARLRKIITDAGPRIQETIKDLQIGETRFLGVLDEEPNVCYFAVLQKIQAGQGDQITTINLTANTVIKGKLLTYTVFAPYVDETTLSNLLKKQKESSRIGGCQLSLKLRVWQDYTHFDYASYGKRTLATRA